MMTAWMSSELTPVGRAGAPIARSSVSAPDFWNVMIRKNSPVTHGITKPYSRKMILERLLDLRHAGRLVGRVVAGERIEIRRIGVDVGDQSWAR